VSSDAKQPLAGEPTARVLVAGASGYSGALAARLVWEHPRLELARTTARSEVGKRLDQLYPQHPVPLVLDRLELDELGAIDAAVVAYPHGASAPLVVALREAEVKVVDLSADFRLHELQVYERWYGEHGAPQLLDGAVYGLTERAAIRPPLCWRWRRWPRPAWSPRW
jgi:N-acetyl-gamma-glutamyl-phosphate reductase